jgi:hypothetical protein
MSLKDLTFAPDLERIIARISSMGSKVVLVTLPGLFTMDEAPSARALSAICR